MEDRAQLLDQQFIQCVKEGRFPEARSQPDPETVGLSSADCIELLTAQITSRHLDLVARQLKAKNQSYYTIGSSGHEANAAIAKAFRVTDTAFLHYRSGAFMIQRAWQAGDDQVYPILLSLVASAEDPISRGRHKVFGSVGLHVPPQTSTIASHLPKAVGCALSLTRAKELAIESELPHDSVVLCSFGDASTNHASALSAFNAAEWAAHVNYPTPIVFICEDNGYGISVPTPYDWVATRFADKQDMEYVFADGLNVVDVYRAAEEAEYQARIKRRPVMLHIKLVRLLGHAGSDIEATYRTTTQIAATEAQDPLLHTARLLLDYDMMQADEIIGLYEAVRAEVASKAEQAVATAKLGNAVEVMQSLLPSVRRRAPKLAKAKSPAQHLPRNMAQSINLALHDLLAQYSQALVFGEDVAKKGGVYHVTTGLMKAFGQRRVFDTLLDETTILGQAIGLSLNGFLPIPEIQFLAYLHNAEDQLRGEAATLPFFSDGQYANPMVVRIASFAYQKGFGGHFHNDNSIAVLRDIPGLVIATPSNGADAARLLRTCVRMAWEEGRVVVFLEPIALYMMKDLHAAGDNVWLVDYPEPKETLPFGEVGVQGDGKDCVIVTYANGYYLSRQAQAILAEQGINVRVVDLRWLAPLPTESLLEAIAGYQHILLVDECRHTGSLSEALMSVCCEALRPLPHIQRLTGHDSFIPLGTTWQYVLPSCDDIVANVQNLINRE